MTCPSLEGHSILVVEDEPLIAMDITQAFEAAGAAVTSTNALKHALILVEHDGLSGAILDHGLADGDSCQLCARLKERGVPFMLYSGFKTVGGACAEAPHIAKPAADGVLVSAMEVLIMAADLAKVEMGPLVAEQRQNADDFHAVEKDIQRLHKALATMGFDPARRAEAEAILHSRITELMRLGQRMRELDASVIPSRSS